MKTLLEVKKTFTQFVNALDALPKNLP